MNGEGDAAAPSRRYDDRELSSPFSFYLHRFLVPGGLWGMALIGVVVNLLRLEWRTSLDAATTGLLAIAAGFMSFQGAPLRRVHWRGDHLRVSDGFRSADISLREIADVSELTPSELRRIRIHLHSSTPFGTQITFIPSLTEFAVVADLRAGAAESQGLAPPRAPAPMNPALVLLVCIAIVIGLAVVFMSAR